MSYVNAKISTEIIQHRVSNGYEFSDRQEYTFDDVEEAISFCSKACTNASAKTTATVIVEFSNEAEKEEEDG